MNDPNIIILRGDCLDVLDEFVQLRNANVDCVIADPPYNISKDRSFNH